MDVKKAIQWIDKNAKSASTGKCAYHVRLSLEAGGLNLSPHPRDAKDYGPTLLAAGFAVAHEFRTIQLESPESEQKGEEAEGASDSIFHGDFPYLPFDSVLVKFQQLFTFRDTVSLPSESATPKEYAPQAGDVVVIQPHKGGSKEGHIAMYTGSAWVSDFRQRDLWGGPGYRKHKPTAVVYRPK